MFKNGLDNVRLIDTLSFNESTIVSWFDTVDRDFSFAIYHLTDQPNILSQLMPYCMWGYMTYVAIPIADYKEAAEVYELFLKDLLAGNNWWENDNNFIIPEEAKEALKKKIQEELDEEIDLYGKQCNNELAAKIKPNLTLIKTEE